MLPAILVLQMRNLASYRIASYGLDDLANRPSVKVQPTYAKPGCMWLSRTAETLTALPRPEFRVIKYLPIKFPLQTSEQRQRFLPSAISHFSRRTIAKINPKLLMASVWPLAGSRNTKNVKDLRRRSSSDANDVDTIRAVAPEYGQVSSAVLAS